MTIFLPLAITAAVLLVGAMAVFAHRETIEPVGGSRWTSTDEVFRDPDTSQPMRVWIDPQDGSRHAVAVGSRPDPQPAPTQPLDDGV